MKLKENIKKLVPKASPKIKPLQFWQSISLGCDPEFFFASADGKTIGSEKLLPKDGLTVRAGDPNSSKTVIDGVQAELNPRSSSCREQLAGEIAQCFRNLYDNVLLSKGIKVQIAPLVDVTQSELDSLSEGSRVFGCAPSTNVYQDKEKSAIKVDPKKYLRRSAGGHIHLGNYYSDSLRVPENIIREADKEFNGRWAIATRTDKALKETPEIMVPVLDIMVGNTCVLLDRNVGNKERRDNYGRVGEYRIKEYGIEYRTLSNFWLKSYPLMSFVLGMARFAVHLVEQSVSGNDYVKALFDAVPREDIIKAINDNDFDLALKNFKKIEKIIKIAAGDNQYTERNYPLKTPVMELFYHFVRRGMDYWFKEDVIAHWRGDYYNRGGWERFLGTIVQDDYNSYKKTAIDLNDLSDPLAPVKKKKKMVLEEVAF